MDVSKEDILSKLREMVEGMFMAKKWQPVVAQRDAEVLTLRQLKPLVLRSQRLKEIIETISTNTNTSVRQVRRAVGAYLDEMGHSRSMSKIRFVGGILCYIMKKNYSEIIVDSPSITYVKSIMGGNPVIFAPSHRSYADFILLSFLCFYYDIEIPVIAAGEDFKSMWLMSKILRDCCAFFIKRSFRDDDLYKAVVAEYISLVISRGHAPFEFFLEGKRSRSGKSVVPKFGLMTMALEPYFLGKVPDVTVIPISITYERVLEDHLFARELLGVPKPRETTLLLLKALQLINENYGRIFVKFGTPISVHKYLCQKAGRDLRFDLHLAEEIPQYPVPKVAEYIKALCFSVILEQNRNMTFASIHLMAASVAIWSSFEECVSVAKITADMEFLEKLLKKLGYPVFMRGSSYSEEILHVAKLHHRIFYLESPTGPLKLHLGMPSVSTNVLSEGCQLSERVISEVYPAVFLQEYANPVCLATANMSIITLIICSAPPGTVINRAYLYQHYFMWRKVFAREFIFEEGACPAHVDFTTAVQHMREMDLFFGQCDDSLTINIHIRRNRAYESILLGMIRPFCYAYLFVLEVCYKMATENVMVPEIMLKFKVQKEMEESKKAQQPKSILSLDTIENAIAVFFDLGVLVKRQQNGEKFIASVLQPCHFYLDHLDYSVFSMANDLRTFLKTFVCPNASTVSKL